MHKEPKKQLRQANSSTYIAGNELFVWIGDTIVLIVGLEVIPVFNRCARMAPIADWPSRFLLNATEHWTFFSFFRRYTSEQQKKVKVN